MTPHRQSTLIVWEQTPAKDIIVLKQPKNLRHTCAGLLSTVPWGVDAALDLHADCANSGPIRTRISTLQAVASIQATLSELVPKLIRSSPKEDAEESPLRRLFWEIIKQITALRVRDYRFDFLSPLDTESDPLMDLLFKELKIGFQRHAPQIRFDQTDPLAGEDGFIRVPLRFWQSEPIGFFSFPKSINTCFLEIRELRKMVDTIMNSIDSVLASLEIKKISLEHQKLSIKDPLTGLSNRHAMEQGVKAMIGRAKRTNTPLSFFFVDADDFKKINDTHGHWNGDKVLIAIANAIDNEMRDEDIVCRYGWEEFLIITQADTIDSQAIAERLLTAIQAIVIQTEWREIQPTCSIGIHTANPSAKAFNLTRSIWFADWALYEAKKRGKNCVVRLGDTNLDFPIDSLLPQGSKALQPVQ